MAEKTPKKITPKKPAPKVEPEAVEELKPAEAVQVQVIERIIESKEIAPSDVFSKLKRPQIDLMKRTIAKGATDDELAMFLQVCKGAQLNPFLKQVHFVKRWDSKIGAEVGAIQIGIDGFRSIAESSGAYAGSDDAVHEGEVVVEFTKSKSDKAPSTVTAPKQATVTVWKIVSGQRYPFTATARWSEYYPGPMQGYMWHKMPYGQLAKCAEGLALRKAFPKLLGGFYIPEEMDQAGARKEALSAGGETAFKTMLSVVAKAKDLAFLDEYKQKMLVSEKYTEEQKKQYCVAVEARIKELEA